MSWPRGCRSARWRSRPSSRSRATRSARSCSCWAPRGSCRHAPNKSASVVRLGVRDARDIYCVRKLIETAAIERAAADPNPNLAPLSDALERLQSATDARDLALLVETDLAFHRCLAALLGSDRLSELFQTIETQLRLAFSIVAFADREYEHPEPLVAEHRQLYDLVRRGHVDRAKPGAARAPHEVRVAPRRRARRA